MTLYNNAIGLMMLIEFPRDVMMGNHLYPMPTNLETIMTGSYLERLSQGILPHTSSRWSLPTKGAQKPGYRFSRMVVGGDGGRRLS